MLAWHSGPVFGWPFNKVYNYYEPTKRCFITCPCKQCRSSTVCLGKICAGSSRSIGLWKICTVCHFICDFFYQQTESSKLIGWQLEGAWPLNLFCITRVKGNWYTFRRSNSFKIVLLPSEKKVYLIWKEFALKKEQLPAKSHWHKHQWLVF